MARLLKAYAITNPNTLLTNCGPMRIQKVKLLQFKRFDDLTIDLGSSPAKIVALLGPNGCGKSSVFDAFELRMKNFRHKGHMGHEDFYSKAKFSTDPEIQKLQYNRDRVVTVTPGLNSEKSLYLRSSYRYTATLNVSEIKAQPEVFKTRDFPDSTADLDDRLTTNYNRLLATSFADFEAGRITGDESKKALIGTVNDYLKEVLEIRISSLGNVLGGKGQLWFEKGNSKDFPYANLSAGEKEILDLLIDLIVKRDHYDDTIYCIDEPELHLNTAVQRRLLKALDKLVPENCQLWIATHSIGFMRALQLDLAAKTQILDFSEKDYFHGTHIISPIKPTRRDWQRIFAIALDDLSELVSPKTLIYCEGRKEPDGNKGEQGLDADVYNAIFGNAHPDTLFVSSGGCEELKANAAVALTILNKAFKGADVLILKDRDTMSDEKRAALLTADQNLRILRRHEIENYLLIPEILGAFCAAKGKAFDASAYATYCTDILGGDLKPHIAAIASLVHGEPDPRVFLRQLAVHVKPGTQAYGELHTDIFGP